MASRIDTIRQTISQTPFLAGRFEIVKMLGTGAAGVVFHVRDRTQNHRDLAMKVLADTEAFDQNTLKRFFRELKILQELRHPNLIEAYDFIAAERLDAFTMELVDGVDLGTLVKNQKLSNEQIDRIFIGVLSALQELHNNGIAHRDLKLENVLVAKSGEPKLTDLGIVKQLSDRGSTQSGLLLGTTQYLPPEYVKYNQYHLSGDIYAMGLMLHECLAGKRWLQTRATDEALQMISEDNFEFPRLALKGLPWKYQNILERALAIEPDDRFQSANEMAEAFRSPTGNPHAAQSVEVKQQLNIADYAALPISLEAESRADFLRRTFIFTVLCLAGLALSLWLLTGGVPEKLLGRQPDLPPPRTESKAITEIRPAGPKINPKPPPAGKPAPATKAQKQ